DLRSVTTGANGAFAAMRKGSIFIDNTTASAEGGGVRDDAARTAGVYALDAPVSGGEAGAENGVLTVMVGGEQAAFDKARPVLGALPRMGGLLGPAGSRP